MSQDNIDLALSDNMDIALKKATGSMLVLYALSVSTMCAKEISNFINTSNKGAFTFAPPYQILIRLMQSGCISKIRYKKPSDDYVKSYYVLTTVGKLKLENQKEQFKAFTWSILSVCHSNKNIKIPEFALEIDQVFFNGMKKASCVVLILVALSVADMSLTEITNYINSKALFYTIVSPEEAIYRLYCKNLVTQIKARDKKGYKKNYYRLTDLGREELPKLQNQLISYLSSVLTIIEQL